MPDIAVHIAQHPTQDRSASRASLLSQLSAEPVEIYQFTGTLKNLGETRYEGFSYGSEPIVSYVDDDDRIEPGIFQKILDAFDSNPDVSAIATQESVTGLGDPILTQYPGQFYEVWHFNAPHHLAAFRRSAIQPYLPLIRECKLGPERALWCLLLMNGHKCMHLPELGYHWDIHEGNVRNFGMPVDPLVLELEQACSRVNPNI